MCHNARKSCTPRPVTRYIPISEIGVIHRWHDAAISGRFYKRELPCLLALLAAYDLQP